MGSNFYLGQSSALIIQGLNIVGCNYLVARSLGPSWKLRSISQWMYSFFFFKMSHLISKYNLFLISSSSKSLLKIVNYLLLISSCISINSKFYKFHLKTSLCAYNILKNMNYVCVCLCVYEWTQSKSLVALRHLMLMLSCEWHFTSSARNTLPTNYNI